jgi:hypothetical protein
MNLSYKEPALMNGIPLETLHPFVGPKTQMKRTHMNLYEQTYSYSQT